MNPPNISSFISINSEGEKLCFSSTPLYYSSDHEDFDVHLEFSDRGCHDIFTHSFDHGSDSSTIDLSKPPVFDDPSFNEVETPQVVQAIQLEMMVIQVLIALRLVPLPNRNLLNLPMLLITLLFTLKSVHFTSFTSSTRITQSYHSCIGGVIRSKKCCETQFLFFLYVCSSFKFEGVYMLFFHTQCDRKP